MSEFVSLVLEPLAHSMSGADVNSTTGAFLEKLKVLKAKRSAGGLEPIFKKAGGG